MFACGKTVLLVRLLPMSLDSTHCMNKCITCYSSDQLWVTKFYFPCWNKTLTIKTTTSVQYKLVWLPANPIEHYLCSWLPRLLIHHNKNKIIQKKQLHKTWEKSPRNKLINSLIWWYEMKHIQIQHIQQIIVEKYNKKANVKLLACYWQTYFHAWRGSEQNTKWTIWFHVNWFQLVQFDASW